MFATVFLPWASAAASVLSLAAVIALSYRMNSHEQAQAFKSKNDSDDNSVMKMSIEGAGAEVIAKRLDACENRLASLETESMKALCEVSTIRFDAFEDIGGKQSFTAAFLNSEGNGVVITGINGRQESRIYAKPIEKGESFFKLSGEETEAIDQALGKIKA